MERVVILICYVRNNNNNNNAIYKAHVSTLQSAQGAYWHHYPHFSQAAIQVHKHFEE